MNLRSDVMSVTFAIGDPMLNITVDSYRPCLRLCLRRDSLHLIPITSIVSGDWIIKARGLRIQDVGNDKLFVTTNVCQCTSVYVVECTRLLEN